MLTLLNSFKFPNSEESDIDPFDDDGQDKKEKYLKLLNLKKSSSISQMSMNIPNMQLSGPDELQSEFMDNL